MTDRQDSFMCEDSNVSKKKNDYASVVYISLQVNSLNLLYNIVLFLGAVLKQTSYTVFVRRLIPHLSDEEFFSDCESLCVYQVLIGGIPHCMGMGKACVSRILC